MDLLEKMKEEIDEKKLKLNCQGGGRIQVDPATRKITVYGYSPVSLTCFSFREIF